MSQCFRGRLSLGLTAAADRLLCWTDQLLLIAGDESLGGFELAAPAPGWNGAAAALNRGVNGLAREKRPS